MSDSVPEGWVNKKFSEVITLQYGKSPQNVLDEDGEFPIWGTGGITGFANSYLHDGESIVIGRKGTIDKPNYVTGQFWAIDTTYYIDDFKNCYSKWFYYKLLLTNLKKYNEATGVPSLNRETLYNIATVLPPLPEQQKIASILTSVDAVIEKTEAQINKLKDLKKAMMKELLTKGIGHTEFKDSPVGRIPKSWAIKKLSEIAKKIKPGPFGSSLTKSMYVDVGYKVYGQEQVISGNAYAGNYFIDEQKYEELSSFRVLAGDVLISLVGTFGKILIIPDDFQKGIINPRLILLRFSADIELAFIEHQLKSYLVIEQLAKFQQGGTMGVLSATTLKPLYIVVPPISEQQQIASILTSIGTSINEKEIKLSHTKSLKKALMQDLLSGKVRVAV